LEVRNGVNGPVPALEVYLYYTVNDTVTNETLFEATGMANLEPSQAGVVPYESAWIDGATVTVGSEYESLDLTFQNVRWVAAAPPVRPTTMVYLDGIPLRDMCTPRTPGQPFEVIVRRSIPAECTGTITDGVVIFFTTVTSAVMGNAVELSR
jgi:hypothetical protein